jgi:signal transduction histidine kinase
MTLARRMWLASAALALLVGAAFTALILAVSAQREATDRESRSKDVTAASLQLEKLVADVESGFLGFTVTRRESFLVPVESARAQLRSQLALLRSLAANEPAQRRRTRTLATVIDDYVNYYVALLIPNLREEPGLADDETIAVTNKDYTDEIRTRFREFRAAEDRLAARAASDAEERTGLAVLVGAIAVGASMALITLFGIVLARSIGRPIKAVAEGAERLAGGELSLRLPAEGPGEVGELTRSFNEMAERLEASHAELEQQNEELRESERMKTELVNIVSHELRTPLASVLGFTALLLKREFDPATRRHYLGIVDAQARRLAALLEDFLDVQRIEHEGVELAAERVDVAGLLHEQAQLYAAQSPKHRVELDVPERPLTVRADPNRLAQVVGNLLSNAIKYSPEGGRVQVHAERSGAGVRIAVRDEGLGIPEDQQSRIFTKFFRGDAGATGITGTGLGLAVSREIVEAHGGSIGFDSDPGEGTTFWLELPQSNGELPSETTVTTTTTKEGG